MRCQRLCTTQRSEGIWDPNRTEEHELLRFVERALEYEIKRQVEVLKDGGEVVQETRLWDTNQGITISCGGKRKRLMIIVFS